uniref:DM domain-containing protein n=1 Tax=Seriola dumerili TaxID=41447 RepID=A0A3B4UA34_SERDU
MSLSKEELTVATAAAAAEEPEPRRPKCTRCRHHGIIVPQKGHMKYCPFLKCDCWKCYLITQRTQIATLQRNLKKAESKPHEKQQQQRTSAPHCFSGRKPAAQGTPSASGPDGGARPSLTSGLMNAPLPVIHFPFTMPSHFPSSYALLPNFMFNMPQLPPAGFYNDSLYGTRIFPHFQQGAVNYPPPQELRPPAVSSHLSFYNTLQTSCV